MRPAHDEIPGQLAQRVAGLGRRVLVLGLLLALLAASRLLAAVDRGDRTERILEQETVRTDGDHLDQLPKERLLGSTVVERTTLVRCDAGVGERVEPLDLAQRVRVVDDRRRLHRIVAMRLLRREAEDAGTEVLARECLGREAGHASGCRPHEHDAVVEVQLAIDRITVAGADDMAALDISEAVEALAIRAARLALETLAHELVHLHSAWQGRLADAHERVVIDDLVRGTLDALGDLGRNIQGHGTPFEVSASRRRSAIASDPSATLSRDKRAGYDQVDAATKSSGPKSGSICVARSIPVLAFAQLLAFRR